MLSTIIWNAAPEIFKTGVMKILGMEIGPLEVRWYGLLFAMGFLVGQSVLIRIFKAEGKPESNVEDLTLYMVVATVLGARLGHCLFYQPDYYLSNPLEILKIWEGGLASHGAALGILFALWFYSRKHPDQSYMWILDRIVIVVALAGGFIRMGNFMNSEIVGKPTEAFTKTIFARDGSNILTQTLNEVVAKGIVDDVEVDQNAKNDTIIKGIRHESITYQVELEQPVEAATIKNAADRFINTYFSQGSRLQEHIYINPASVQPYSNASGKLNRFSVEAWGVPRHPSQLYESISCFLLFMILLNIYFRYKAELPSGLIFGIFMIWIWGLRFVYEFFKENQVAFEDDLSLNMGQTLSIPLTIIGFIVLARALKAKKRVDADKNTEQ